MVTNLGVREDQTAKRLLDNEERWARRAHTRANVAWWDASISGKPRDYERMGAAERAINRHYARPTPFRRLSSLLEAPLNQVTRRRVERLRNAYHSMQAPRELLDRITAASTAVQERYSTFRGAFEGKPRTDNELEEVLRTTCDSRRARSAWEARKQIGPVVADAVRRLAELRNEAAREVGFPDFWHQQMILDELDPKRMTQTLEAVDQATVEPFTAMKRDLDRQLAERFNVSERELWPWHYANPYFQEAPDVFAPPADPIYAERDVVELAARTYRELGFDTIDAILARSDLYPRSGKNQHAYAVDIDHEGDVRSFLNVEPDARWMGTLLHELGHTVYQDGIDRTKVPYDLRDDPQGFLNEGLAMFCEQSTFDAGWLADVVELPREEATSLAPQFATQEVANLLAFVRWCLTIVTFERAFYADPAQDLNTLWWDLVERYQQVRRPRGRDEPDWASKVHVATSPVYYHKYLYGRMFSAQLTEEITRRFGGWWPGRHQSGRYVAENLFAPGAVYPWPELVERVTGKPLGVASLAASLAWSPPH